jgi:hypothetical protein
VIEKHLFYMNLRERWRDKARYAWFHWRYANEPDCGDSPRRAIAWWKLPGRTLRLLFSHLGSRRIGRWHRFRWRQARAHARVGWTLATTRSPGVAGDLVTPEGKLIAASQCQLTPRNFSSIALFDGDSSS